MLNENILLQYVLNANYCPWVYGSLRTSITYYSHQQSKAQVIYSVMPYLVIVLVSSVG